MSRRRPFVVEPWGSGYRVTLRARRWRRRFPKPVYLGCKPFDGVVEGLEVPHEREDELLHLHRTGGAEIHTRHVVNLLLEGAARHARDLLTRVRRAARRAA